MDLIEWLRELSSGILVTIELSAVSAALTILFASLLALLRISPFRILRVIARLETDVFRSIPLLALLIFLYYAVAPTLDVFGRSSFWHPVLQLTPRASTYLS